MTEDRQYIQRLVEYFHKEDAQQLIGRYYESRKKDMPAKVQIMPKAFLRSTNIALWKR